MVDPISNDERERTFLWVKFATVLLVGISAGLMAIQGGAQFEIVLGAVGGGVLVGAALVWYLFPGVDVIAPASSRRYRE